MNTNHKLGAFLEEIRKKYQDQPVFMFSEGNAEIKSVRYSEFMNDINMGLAEGNEITAGRIAMLGYNSYEWIVTAVSLLLAGKHLILLDPDLSDQNMQHLLRYTDTECILMSESLLSDQSFPDEIFQIGTFFKRHGNCANEMTNYYELPDKVSDFICFTSGTTKSSKGVVIESNALAEICWLEKDDLMNEEKEKVYISIPLHHVFPLTMIFHSMLKGKTICLGNGARYLKQELRSFEPDVIITVPSLIAFLFKDTQLKKSFHTIFTAGSRCRRELCNTVKSQGIHIVNVYGASETISGISHSRRGCPEERLYPCNSVRFCIRENNEIGVILPVHMQGYYKKDIETEAVLSGDCYWTGDEGILYEDGSVEIQGRIRDTIVLENGEKIHAEDTDDILSELHGVKEAAAIYSYKTGLTAVVVLDDLAMQKTVDGEIRGYNRKCNPKHRIEHICYRADKLPRTSTGKLKRRELELEYF